MAEERRRCILTDGLYDFVLCGGVKYPVKTDFRAWLLFASLIGESAVIQDKVKSREKLMEALSAVMDFARIDKLSGSFRELISALFLFYSGEEKEKLQTNDRKSSVRPRAKYDFILDADYIFASFFEVYGIDLCEQRMHWHKFLALFRSLPEGCFFSKVLSYRSCDLSKLKGEERRYYSEMKEYYALPDNRSREEKDAEIYASLAAMI